MFKSQPPSPTKTSCVECLRDRIRARSIVAQMTQLGLPDFESLRECEERQKQMLARFSLYPPSNPNWQDLWKCTLRKCGSPACSEACWYATMHRRYAAMKTGLPLLEAHPGPKWAVTIVHPLWQKPIKQLNTISIKAAAQWNHRRLKGLGIPDVLAIGGFEVSVNLEIDGTKHWAGEIQQIVCGATKEQLEKAFAIQDRYRDLRPRQHILDIRGFDSLARKLAYGQKRFVQMREAFISPKNGRQNRKGKPPRSDDWAELDSWMLDLPIGARVVLFGCARRGTTIFKRDSKEN